MKLRLKHAIEIFELILLLWSLRHFLFFQKFKFSKFLNFKFLKFSNPKPFLKHFKFRKILNLKKKSKFINILDKKL